MKRIVYFTGGLLLVIDLLSYGTQAPLTNLKAGEREMVIYFPSKSQRLQRAGERLYADSEFLGLGLETTKLFFEGRAKELFKGHLQSPAGTGLSRI